MAGTRSSSRLAANTSASPPSAKSESNNKRKADESSPSATKSKRGKKAKDQKTLEETISSNQDGSQDVDMTDAQEVTNGKHEAGEDGYERGSGCWFWLDNAKYDNDKSVTGNPEKTIEPGSSFQGKNKEGEDGTDPEKALKDSRGSGGLNSADAGSKQEPESAKDDLHETDEAKPAKAHHETHQDHKEATSSDHKPTTQGDGDNGAIEESKDRAEAQPSNILEKGLIYFFTRGRVSVDEPESVQDLARSYFVLRPLPAGAKLTSGAIDELGNNRLFALPKKVWPKSGRDRFMAFVEQAKTTMSQLKESFFQGSEYETKTTGTRQAPPVTPLGEGVYAITSTGNRGESHLAYMLTIPREMGEIQEDVGIRAKGSFVMSLKNPTVKGPANASLPQGPGYPQEFIDEFRSRSWMPVEPKHLDYANAQVLLIGEDIDSHALDATKKDEESSQKETPAEEMEKLEHEDEIRVTGLKGDDTVFADLGLSSQDYPSVQTTW